MNFPEDISNSRLRESVLTTLWDSVPPEEQIKNHWEDEVNQSDVSSDRTVSGLDKEDDCIGEACVRGTPNIPFPAVADALSGSLKSQEQDEVVSSYRSALSSESQHCFHQKENLDNPWEINFGFIQAVIWLKSMTAKLQRVPADEFCRVFRNQWQLSQKISSNLVMTDPLAGPIFASPMSTPFYPGSEISTSQSPRSDVIPETPESKSVNPVSVKSRRVRSRQVTTTTLLCPPRLDSTVDSGFASNVTQSEVIKSSSHDHESKIETNFIGTREDFSNSEYHAQLLRRNLLKRAEKERITKKNVRAKSAVSSAVSEKIPSKQQKPSISSVTLNCVLRSAELNKLLHNSVKAILDVLMDEKSHTCFKNWQGSVQKDAIECIATLVNQLDKERGSDLCKREVVNMVVKVIENMLLINDADKATIWEHHRLMVLELCNTQVVCTGVVSYLISQLNALISAAAKTTGENTPDSLMSLEKSFILFHALEVVLMKYKSFAACPAVCNEEENALHNIPKISELWKKNWRIQEPQSSDVFLSGVEISLQNQKQVWTRVLEEMVVVSTTIWPQVTFLAWHCLTIIKNTPK